MEKLNGGIVLIVDDEAEIREIIAMIIAPMGYQILEAADGEQALEVVRARSVDVIISDLMMPRVTGIALLSKLREEGHAQPFIFLTAYPSQDSTLHALRLGAFDYIEKPFDGDELKVLTGEAMRVALEMKRLDVKGNLSPKQAVSQATREIQKLKVLRYSDDDKAGRPVGADRKLHDMFIAEATPQLLFCEASIKGLMNPDDRAFELGYLFRVMQAIGNAADAIGAQAIAELARAAERFYTSLRVRPRSVTVEVIDLARATNAALQEAVGGFGPMMRAAEARSSEMVKVLSRATADLEAGRVLKAS